MPSRTPRKPQSSPSPRDVFASSARRPNLDLLEYAITLAAENARSGKGGPFASLIVVEGRVIAQGTNLVTSMNDPTAHAEIIAIRRACQVLESLQLTGAEIYSSCEPCPMCVGAIYWARANVVFYAATSKDAAEAGFDDALIYRQITVPGEKRIIPMIHVPSPNAGHSFHAWQHQTQRVDY